MTVKVNELNSLALAYIGDAVYEMYVREFLINSGEVKPQQLHNDAVRYVTAPAQATVVKSWLENGILTKEEEAIVRRGRNAKSHSVPKNVSLADYRYATAFEALIGYHYLAKSTDRLNTLLEDAITFQVNDSSGQEGKLS